MSLIWLGKVEGWRRWAVTINLIGLLDFIVAIGIGSGILHSEFLNQLLYNETAIVTIAFESFPMALFPLFVVPLGIVLHIYSLKKLIQEKRQTN